MRKATIRSLLAHKLRLALTGLAIVLGVGFVAGTLILSDTLNATFDTLFKGIESGVDVRVRAKKSFSEQQNNDERQPVPASLLSEVRHIDGVKAAAGEVEGTAILIDHKGKAITPRGPPTLGETFTDIAKHLEAAGVERNAVEAQAEAVTKFVLPDLATKADLAAAEARLEQAIERSVERSEHRLTVRFFGLMLGVNGLMNGILFALLRFVH